MPIETGRRLLQLGVLLFLLGLLTGMAIPIFENPRMGLSSHLEAILNGLFLIALGLLWARLDLGWWSKAVAFWSAVYAGFANWLATLLAAYWGAGAAMMPLAGGEQVGSAAQELAISALLLSLSAAVVLACVLVLWGLRGRALSRKA
jgi:hydroxylaminobenzene mutase